MSDPNKKFFQTSLTILILGIVLIAVGYFGYRALDKMNPGSTVAVYLDKPEPATDGRFQIPILVKNQGNYSFEGLQIAVLLEGDGKIIEKASCTVDQLAPRQQQTASVFFETNPQSARKIFSNVEKFKAATPKD